MSQSVSGTVSESIVTDTVSESIVCDTVNEWVSQNIWAIFFSKTYAERSIKYY